MGQSAHFSELKVGTPGSHLHQDCRLGTVTPVGMWEVCNCPVFVVNPSSASLWVLATKALTRETDIPHMPLLEIQETAKWERHVLFRSQAWGGVGGPHRALRDNVHDGSNAERGCRDRRLGARSPSQMQERLRCGGVDTQGTTTQAWERMRGSCWDRVGRPRGQSAA